MPKFKQILILLLFLLPVITFAQSGKIVGTVTDLETGEALLGANVLVEGTTLGAATNENGEYLILNVPAGTYTLKARYIGYQEVTMSNIRVSVNLTTEANFALPSELYETDLVTVVAPKPLINKNITNSTDIVGKDDIKNLPVRGVNALIANQAGVVNQGGNLYVRGSRSDAVAYYVDGVLVNNPVFGGARTQPIQNAIEEVQFQAGGYTAEFGGANGGIISTTSRVGSENYNFSIEAITDNIPGSEVGKEFGGGWYPYGYSEYSFTAGGPVWPSVKNLKFFVAGSNVFRRTAARYYREYDFPVLFDATLGASADTTSIYRAPHQSTNSANNTYQGYGSLIYEVQPFTIKVNANYEYREYRGGFNWKNIMFEDKASLNEEQTLNSSVKITHAINNKSFYDVIFNYFDDFYVTMDPYFKHDILAYGDSIANAGFGYYPISDGQWDLGVRAFNTVFEQEGTSGYRKMSTKSFGGKANFLYQIGKHHEFKTGGDFTYYTIRRYSYGPFSLLSNLMSRPDGDIRDVYDRLDNYGYDVYGNKIDDEIYGPKNPVFAAFYIQDKMEYSDLVVNLGFRLDYIDIDSKTFENANNVQFDADDIIDPDYLVDVEPLLQISPRLGFSFPVTDRTNFHAQYGKFIQQSQLRNVYLGFNNASDIIKGGFAELNPVGYGLRPERTTQYEIGFRQQLGDNFAFDVTGFYKDIRDQIQARPIFAEAGAQHSRYYALVNGDFSTTKGFELKFDLRRTNRLSATVDYTYSDAQGTGSTPNDAARMIWQSPTKDPFFPQQIAPLSFNQTHSGAMNIDYRFGEDDGPEIFGSKIFSELGANLLFTFSSGFNYTRWTGFNQSRIPTEQLNESTTPWTFQLDLRVDKSFEIGPLSFNAYVWVVNLLDTKNVISVFNVTGDPYDDGYLSSTDGQRQISEQERIGGEAAAQLYQEVYLANVYDANNFGPPRQVNLGIRIEY